MKNNKIYYYFNLLRKRFISKKYYYSYSGVDALADYIFKDTHNGVYVDVGCQHPIFNNNTYLLHKKGWSGINIDLDKSNIDLFNYARNKDTNINKAVSYNDDEANLYFYHTKSPINTIVKKTADHQKAEVKEIKKIRTCTLNSIIEKSSFDKKINFLTIDVEGNELNVLKGFNFKKYCPDLIVTEFLDLSMNKLEFKNNNLQNIINSEIYNLLLENNYSLVNWIHGDLIFVNNNFKD